MEAKEIELLIYEGLSRLEEETEGLSLPRSGDTLLYGFGSQIDSLDLVTLVLFLEERLSHRVGRKITLASERALSQEKSPFSRVETLRDFILTQIQEGTF